MKKHYLILFIFLLSFSTAFASHGIGKISNDTIIIDFGNKSKILIYVSSEKDFEELRNYDLNKMLKDLNIALDSTNKEIKVVKIEDNSGRYLQGDSVAVVGSYNYELEEQNDISVAEDTTRSTVDTSKVVTINVGKISIKIRDDDKTVDIQKDKRPRRTRHSFNLDLGMNNYLSDGKFPDEQDALYTVKPFGSWYVGINSIRKTRVSGPLFIEWGGGLSWYNFKFQDNTTRISKEEFGTLFYKETNPINPIKSKLTASYINLSFVPLLDFGYSKKNAEEFSHKNYSTKGFRFGVGGFAGYRVGSKSKYVFKEDGDKRKVKDRSNFYLNNWRYGVRLQMGYRGMDIFANYDISELFLENRGPQLNAFSFGISL